VAGVALTPLYNDCGVGGTKFWVLILRDDTVAVRGERESFGCASMVGLDWGTGRSQSKISLNWTADMFGATTVPLQN
jgi:hypothetical protein